MKKEELFREIGFIDEELVEDAARGGAERRRRGISRKWVAVIACLVLYSSTSTVLWATEYHKNRSSEPYIRYLTAEQLELAPRTEYDADKFLQALKSGNDEYVYIAINRLVESFNSPKSSGQALKALRPLMTDDNPKIADAAAFAEDILSKQYERPGLIKLADGSIAFTLFPGYSDYGSQNVIWRIKDDVLEPYFSFTAPSMYIKDMIPSPDGERIAVVTASYKSEFLQILNIEEDTVSPELVESARVQHGAGKEWGTWIRPDHENYSSPANVRWADNDSLMFDGSLAYEDTTIIENVAVTYRVKEKVLEMQEKP